METPGRPITEKQQYTQALFCPGMRCSFLTSEAYAAIVQSMLLWLFRSQFANNTCCHARIFRDIWIPSNLFDPVVLTRQGPLGPRRAPCILLDHVAQTITAPIKTQCLYASCLPLGHRRIASVSITSGALSTQKLVVAGVVDAPTSGVGERLGWSWEAARMLPRLHLRHQFHRCGIQLHPCLYPRQWVTARLCALPTFHKRLWAKRTS